MWDDVVSQIVVLKITDLFNKFLCLINISQPQIPENL